jgi:nicotinamide mononucleotide adenylyltransferase
LFLKRGLSVRYLLPAPVVEYIEANSLYQDGDTAGANKDADKGKERERLPSTSASTTAKAT